jgi:starch phosphorylase
LNHTYQDEVESNALYNLLESEVLPLFYQCDTDNLPLAWIGCMKEAIGVLAANFNTNRMVREYAERLYLPNQLRWQALNADYERTDLLSQWKSHVRSNWSQIEILQVESVPPGQIKVGTHIPLKMTVRLGELEPNDIKVELYMGPGQRSAGNL